MKCLQCGESAARCRRKTQAFGSGKDLLVIENIPIVSCPDCGESYLTAETLHEIERIRTHRKQFAVERTIPVARHVACFGFPQTPLDNDSLLNSTRERHCQHWAIMVRCWQCDT